MDGGDGDFGDDGHDYGHSHDNGHHNQAHDKTHGHDSHGGHSANSFTHDLLADDHADGHHEEKKAQSNSKSVNVGNNKTADVESRQKNIFHKSFDKALKNFKNSTPKMQFVKGTALVGSAILAANGVKNLISMNSDKSEDKDNNKNKIWKEVGKIGAAAAITYFAVLKGNGKAVSGGGAKLLTVAR